MDSFDPIPNWSDPVLLAAIKLAFDSTWPEIRAQEAGNDKARLAELSMALSRRLAELAANGVTDPHELQRRFHSLRRHKKKRPQEARPEAASQGQSKPIGTSPFRPWPF
jgi:hypothetical protein